MGDIISGKVRGPSKHAVNRWVAGLMPLVMMGLVGYATWVLVVLICSQFPIYRSSILSSILRVC